MVSVTAAWKLAATLIYDGGSWWRELHIRKQLYGCDSWRGIIVSRSSKESDLSQYISSDCRCWWIIIDKTETHYWGMISIRSLSKVKEVTINRGPRWSRATWSSSTQHGTTAFGETCRVYQYVRTAQVGLYSVKFLNSDFSRVQINIDLQSRSPARKSIPDADWS